MMSSAGRILGQPLALVSCSMFFTCILSSRDNKVSSVANRDALGATVSAQYCAELLSYNSVFINKRYPIRRGEKSQQRLMTPL